MKTLQNTLQNITKKGSADMWWIIIGAVIALVVMIILMVMFTGKSNKLEGGLLACEGKGGACVADSTACSNKDGSQGTISNAFDCGPGSKAPGGVCCFSDAQK